MRYRGCCRNALRFRADPDPRRADRTRGIDPWRSAGGAVNAAATLAEAQGRILGRTFRAGKQGAGPNLEETVVTA
jgi:hypothetical protein